MKKVTLILAVAIATTLFSFKAINAIWSLDNSHTKIGFTATHLLISDVDGYFKDVTATVTSSKPDFSDAVAEMTAKVNSIYTNSEQRDGHLQSADFFDAEKFPTITFKSTSFKKSSKKNHYKVKGNLTMRGITKSVTFDGIIRTAENPYNKKTVAGFKITGEINRKDFGIGTTTPAAIVSDTIEIVANAEFTKE